MKITVYQTCVISRLMDKHKISLKDIKRIQRPGKTKTDTDKAVCMFHNDLRLDSSIFSTEYQAELFNLSIEQIYRRWNYFRRNV